MLNTVVASDVAMGDARSVHELAFGAGLTSWWKPAIAIEIVNLRGESPSVEALEFENVFLLPFGEGGHEGEGDDHSGGYAVGLYAAAELPVEGDEDPALTLGPIGKVTVGPVTAIGNFFFDIPASAETPGIVYALSVSAPVTDALAVGIEAHGGVEELFGDETPDLCDQEHLIGPAVHGEFELGDGRSLEPRLAVLFGLTDAAPDVAVSLNLEVKV